MLREKEILEENPGTIFCGLKETDIVADNVDIAKISSKMSKYKQTKSWHWFVLLALQKRVVDDSLSDMPLTLSIIDVSNGVFIPSISECHTLEENCLFHMKNIFVKYLGCFKKYSDCLPQYISHPHMNETAKKSDFVVLDLLDKNENKSEDKNFATHLP